MLMDEQTSSWGRCSYARVCVRIDLARKLPKGIWAHGLNGRFFQPIEYEGIPILCSKCGRIGHKIEECKEQLIQKSKEGQVGKENREQKEGELRNLDVEKLNSMKVMDCGGGPIMNGQTVQEADDEEGSWTIVARRRNRNVRNGSRNQTNKPAVWREAARPKQDKPSVEKQGTNEVIEVEGYTSTVADDPRDSESNSKLMMPAEKPKKGMKQDKTPTQMLLPKVLAVAESRKKTESLFKTKKKRERPSKLHLIKELANLGPLEDLPRKRKSAGTEQDMDCGREGLCSEPPDCSIGGDASPLVN